MASALLHGYIRQYHKKSSSMFKYKIMVKQRQEYLFSNIQKVLEEWYGTEVSMSLCPTFCRNNTGWLASCKQEQQRTLKNGISTT